MIKVLDGSKISAWTSAGAFVVTTKPTKFVGVSFSGSAAATYITIFDGITTGGRTIGSFYVGITAGTMLSFAPIICTSGIVATNIGTLASYAVIYSS